MPTDIKKIDALLPQTQCGLCGYGGCLPYAKALAEESAPINLCPPGGVKTLKSLAKHLNKDAEPYLDEMKINEKPTSVALIIENECIGCTKCIQACPVDAIIGSAKNMHTVITDECTGCELCVEPCPVDCIEMLVVKDSAKIDKAHHFRKRYQNRQQRLAKTQNSQQACASAPTKKIKTDYVAQAIARAQARKKNIKKV